MKILISLCLTFLIPLQGGYQYPTLTNPDVDWCSPTIDMPIVDCLENDTVMLEGCAEMWWPTYYNYASFAYAEACVSANDFYQSYFLSVMEALDHFDNCCYVNPDQCLGGCTLELAGRLVVSQKIYNTSMEAAEIILISNLTDIVLNFADKVREMCCHDQ